MNTPKEQIKLNLDITATQPILTPDGNHVVTEGFVLRKVSKFISGTAEDGVIPIPCFYDVKTSRILIETLPKELRAEYEEYQEASK
jgi:hypothetical protein